MTEPTKEGYAMQGTKYELIILYTSEAINRKLPPMTKAQWENATYMQEDLHSYNIAEMEVDASTTEKKLKEALKNEGIIEANPKYYKRSRLFFAKGFNRRFEEIAIPGSEADRTLGELGITKNSILIVYAPEEPRRYIDYSNMTCMYGCPVTDRDGNLIAPSEAENYDVTQSDVNEVPLT